MPEKLKKRKIKKIKKYHKKGLKPAEIADKINISVSTVYRYLKK